MPCDHVRTPVCIGLFLTSAAIVVSSERAKRAASSSSKAGGNTKASPVGDSSTSSDTSSMTRPHLAPCTVVFVIGGPGAGKGTQCELLEQRKGWTHLSTGDLLRTERKNGGELGDLINARIDAGELVPSDITVRVLERGMAAAKGKSKFLIDGFPRSAENMAAWDDLMGSVHSTKFVLCYECPEDVLVGRLLERGKSSGRSDDNIDVIRKRFQTFQKESLPVVDQLQQQGIAVHKIASDSGVEEVYEKTAKLF